MAKTKQQGYYKLKPADKWLHFSMNCWVNLKQNSGKDMTQWSLDFHSGDVVDQIVLLSDLAYAAMSAYDQEEGNEIDYNIYKVRNWVSDISNDPKQIEDLIEAMTHNVSTNKGKKNQAAKK